MQYRNRKYLDWLKRQSCVVCGSSPCDPAHQPSPWKGVGLKSPDTYCLPLCRECHEAEHRGRIRFWGKATECANISSEVPRICLEHFTRFLQEGKNET